VTRTRQVGMLAEYATPADLLRAVEALRGLGYRLLDGYVPYPVPGLEEALGLTRSWLNIVSGGAGALGAAFAFWLQWLVNHRLLPLDIGGRPSFAIPSFVIVAFETMVLFAGVTAFVAFVWVCRLPRLSHPVLSVDGFQSASLDRFWLGVSADDPRFDPEQTEEDLRRAGATRVEIAKDWP
jgi:Protein of unknown function (DUF3341)